MTVGGRPPEHRLRIALRNVRDLPVASVAVLVTETGALECIAREGDPNFIDQLVTMHEAGINRTFTYRYVRTDLCAQGGYRVYTLHELDSGDFARQGTSRRGPKSVHGPYRGPRLRDELSGFSGEDRDDDS